jgi:hypothetical protein
VPLESQEFLQSLAYVSLTGGRQINLLGWFTIEIEWTTQQIAKPHLCSNPTNLLLLMKLTGFKQACVDKDKDYNN